MIDVAYLRVYRPSSEVRLPVSHSSGDVPRIGVATITTESQVADAWEVGWQGRTWRCPRGPRRRLLESLVAFHRATNRFGVGIVDGAVADAARRELAHIRAGEVGPGSVMVSAWHPPMRWFVGFTVEAIVAPMVMRADLGEVHDRLVTVVTEMRRVGLPTMWVDDIGGVEAWLGAFDGPGMVELDYRQVGWRLGPTMIDDTASDVAGAVDALLGKDLEEAAYLYGVAMVRWADAHAVNFSS